MSTADRIIGLRRFFHTFVQKKIWTNNVKQRKRLHIPKEETVSSENTNKTWFLAFSIGALLAAFSQHILWKERRLAKAEVTNRQWKRFFLYRKENFCYRYSHHSSSEDKRAKGNSFSRYADK